MIDGDAARRASPPWTIRRLPVAGPEDARHRRPTAPARLPPLRRAAGSVGCSARSPRRFRRIPRPIPAHRPRPVHRAGPRGRLRLDDDRGRRDRDQLDRDRRLLRPLPHDGPRAQGLRDVAPPRRRLRRVPRRARRRRLGQGQAQRDAPADRRPDRAPSRRRSRPPTTPTCRRPATPACAATTPSRSSPNGGPVKLVVQDAVPRGRAEHAATRSPWSSGRPASAASRRRAASTGTSTPRSTTSRPTRAPRRSTTSTIKERGRRGRGVHRGQPGHRLGRRPARHRPAQGRARSTRRMDCIDCHNRVGHGIPTPDQAIDDSHRRTAGSTRTCPTSSARAMRSAVDRLRLGRGRRPRDRRAARLLRDAATRSSPTLKAPQIDAAIDGPQADLPAGRHPGDAGHRRRPTRTTWATSRRPGCFRCHDGAHYKVVNGALTSETIPSACATCHTFPQIGAVESGVPHRRAAGDPRRPAVGLQPQERAPRRSTRAERRCGACHTRTYCENCHDTAAVNVTHDDMISNHAEVMHEDRSPGLRLLPPAGLLRAAATPKPVLPEPFPHAAPSPLDPSVTVMESCA